MTERRRLRHLFPGVPNPGGPDPDVTHAYPGLADELRAEREIEPPVERQEPAVTRYPLTPDYGATPPGGIVKVQPLDEQGRPTDTPWREVGRTVEPPRFTYEPGDDDPTALRDLSRDLPAATPDEVEAWRAEAPAHPVWGGDRRAVSDGTAPEGDEAEPQYRRSDMVPDRPTDARPPFPVTDVVTDDPVEVHLGCGCRIVVHACRPTR
jgi:hypothetical protein